MCDGLWNRNILGTEVTGGLHNVTKSTFHGEPDYVFFRQDKDGNVIQYRGTFRSTKCLKVAVMPGSHTPNGTSKCNFCARLTLDETFKRYVIQAADAKPLKMGSKFTRNDNLSFDQMKSKLLYQANEIKLLQQYRCSTFCMRKCT